MGLQHRDIERSKRVAANKRFECICTYRAKHSFRTFDPKIMQKIKYATHSKYLSDFEIWLSTMECAIKAGETVSTFVEPITGFLPEQVRFEILPDEPGVFETEWLYAKKNFPSRLKILATALRNCGFYGRYFSSHCGGKMELRRIEQAVSVGPR